jgi:exodeoxyribonuclease V gamma subunit
MLNVYQGNRLEVLADRLAELVSEPAGPALAPEEVVVQGAGMARWVSARLAGRLGVCANVRFTLPAAFVWGCFRAVVPTLADRSPYEPGPLAWRVFGAIEDAAGEPGFEPVRAYLAGGDALKRFRLAGRVAQTLDRYLVYRPDWVRAWEAGEGGDWQAALWRRLAAGAGDGHWVRARDAFVAAVGGADPALRSLPGRVTLFAPGDLSPGFLDVLVALAEVTEVHLLLPNPCREYWSDVESPGAVARRRARWRREGRSDASRYFDTGNPLLASWGRAGRDFLDRLQEVPALEEELYVEPERGRLLGALQGDILDLADRGRPGGPPRLGLGADDLSVQVHACHGPLREVQVLHDRLLDLFARLPGLEPRDVLVMAPDLEAYAPHVEAVFSAAPAARHIPWALAGGGPSGEEPTLAAFLQLLDLPASRLPATEVLGLLEVPAVRRRLGLEPDDLATLRRWVRESGIRWGADASARASAGLPELEANSWAFGLKRLFLGYGMPDGSGLFAGVLPCAGVEGAAAEVLGSLQDFLDRLGAWQVRLAHPRSARAWAGLGGELLDDLFRADEEEGERLREVREALAALADETDLAGFGRTFGREVFKARLGELLGGRGGAPPLLSGGVTFAGLGALRGIPARVVCLLGMNGADFPRVDRPPGFDLTVREPRRGDRSRRDEDRYLFLEALLSARDVLYVSYVGRSARDDTARVPSVVVSELLDYLDQAFDAGDRRARERVVTGHPLQPFSRRYFDGGDPRLFSYATEWLPAASGPAPGPSFADGGLAPPDPGRREVGLEALLAFLRSPARHFLKEGLGVRLAEAEAALEDSEVFRLDGLARYRLKDRLLAGVLGGADAGALRALARAAGELPAGAAGELAYREMAGPVEALAGAAAGEAARALEPLEVDLTLGAFRLRGWLRGLTPQGVLGYRPARVRARDWIELWVRHLVLNALAPAGSALASRHLGEDGEVVRLAPVADAAGRLEGLLGAYWQGLSEPLPLFPETSFAYASAVLAGKDPGGALRAARPAWHDAHHARGESLDPDVRLAWRGRDPLGPRFRELALDLLGPMVRAARAAGDAGASV